MVPTAIREGMGALLDRARQTWQPRVRALVRGDVEPQDRRDFTRFIILGRSRTGSNYLRSLLNSHRQVRVLGEVFRNADAVDWDYPGYPIGPDVVSLYQRDPLEFLGGQVFGPVARSVAAVGFKIFYYHAFHWDPSPVWEYLQNQTDIRVVHIKRSNILRTHLSRARAARTGRWVDTAGNSGSAEGPISLSYEDCLEDFVRTREWEMRHDALFAGHPRLEVIYETLNANQAAEIARVQSFLGVRTEPVAAGTFRQSTLPLSASIANYQELKDRFAGSSWAGFFEE